jgi:NADPH-dependent 2,4-dienoyl-CoA reductase/sulfur reductase-like enzyme
MHHTYLIVGGGMSGDSAVRGIREVDERGSIAMLCAEEHYPYNRPPLTKGLWKGQPEEQIWRDTPGLGADLYLRRRAVALDAGRQTVTDDRGEAYSYDQLLLATGGTPKRLPFGGDDVNYFRTFDDYRRLREESGRAQRFVVIGGGFIGAEIAAALGMNGKQVTMLFPEAGIGGLVFPAPLARFLNGYYKEKGVDVRPGELAAGYEHKGTARVVRTKSGTMIEGDGVIAGLGIAPNVDLAKGAGLQVDNGVVVDEYLRTTDPRVFAAGDVASFYNPALGRRLRVEHEDNANMMGQAAGRNMAGRMEPYHHLPFFYSDLFDLGYEAVGELNSAMETVEDWKEPFHEGVVYYLRDGRVRGVLLWNAWEQVDNARALITEPGPFTAKQLKGRLPA